jgi:chromosome partitioning protein
MAKIITIAHQKGGVGKSTLALNLALCFKGELSVAIVDTDLQGSLFHIRDDFPGLPILMPNKVVNLSEPKADLVIVDTPPYLSDQLPELFFYSDFILIPTKAGFFDVMAIRSTLAMVRQVRQRAFNIRCGVVLNMIKPRPASLKKRWAYWKSWTRRC